MANIFPNLAKPAQTALTNKLDPKPLSAASMYGQKPNPVSNLLNSSVQKPANTPFSVGMTKAPEGTPGLVSPKSSTPLRSSTTTMPNGASVKHEYHAPAKQQTAATTPTAPASQNNPNFSGVTSDASYGAGTAKVQPEVQQPTPIQQPQASQQQPSQAPTSYGGLVQGLSNVGTQGSQGYNDAIKRLADYDRQVAQTYGNVASEPIPLVFRQGRQQVLAQQAAAERGALQSAVNQQQTQQGQQISALGTAAGLAAPMQVSPGNALVNPQTAREQYSGLGGLTGLGIAQQNIRQGQQFQNEAAQLSNTLQQIDTLAPTLTNFIAKSGLNTQGTPVFNQSLKTYIKNVQNPGDVVSLNAMLADLKTYTAQVLGSSGLNPTEVSETIASFDPSDLTGEQLSNFITNLRNLGQIRLQPLQQSTQASYGANTQAGNPYAGPQAAPTTESALNPNVQNAVVDKVGGNQILQGLIGGGINSVGGIVNGIKGIAKLIL